MKLKAREILPAISWLVAAFFMYRQNIHGSLDTTFFYTGVEARAYLAQLSPDESHRYLIKEYFDLMYIASYSLILFAVAGRYFTKKKSLLYFLPGVLDLIETVTIIYLLQTRQWQIPLDWLGVVSCLKWTTAAMGIIVLMYQILMNKRQLHDKG